jgi:hypothetical protein
MEEIERKNLFGIWLKTERKIHFEDEGIDGRIILEWGHNFVMSLKHN